MSRSQIWDGTEWVDMGIDSGGAESIVALVLIDEYEADGTDVCTFTGIPANCEGLVVVANLRSDSSTDTWEDLGIRLGDGSVDSGGSNYYSERWWGSSSGDSVTSYWMQPSGASPGNAANDELGFLTIEITPSYNDATKDTMGWWHGGRYDSQDTTDRITQGFGSYLVNNVVDTIQLLPLNGTYWEAGTVKLYGYRLVQIQGVAKPYGCTVYRSAAWTFTDAGAGYTVMTWDTEVHDEGDCWDSANGSRFTAPVAGFYTLQTHVGVASAGLSGDLVVWRHTIDGTAKTYITDTWPNSHWPVYQQVVTMWMEADEYMELWYHNDNSNETGWTGSLLTFASFTKTG